jgi:riboflavin kinase/FMN adenylyltransferase
MPVIEWSQFLEEALPLGGKPSAVTVGVFDGVHRGHKALIEQVVSQKKHAVPVVVCFRQSQHKEKNRDGREYPGDILTIRQKMAVFESLGVSITIIIDFSEPLMRMSGADFLRILQEHGKMTFMAVGSNFRCGYQLDTDAQIIKKLNAGLDIQTCIVEPLAEGGQPISSSQIRAAIAQGNLKEANAMLGRPFTVDLFGASVSHTSGGAEYDIAGRGGILPPPGKYQVLFLDKSCDQSAGKPAEITVEDGSIRIAEDFTGVFPEFIRFYH